MFVNFVGSCPNGYVDGREVYWSIGQSVSQMNDLVDGR